MKKMLILVAALALLVVVMTPAVAAAQGADEWSQYQKDATHTGAMNVDLPVTNRVARRTDNIDAMSCSQPVISGCKAYVYTGMSGSSSAVYCYDLKSGKALWHTTVATVSSFESWSSPAVVGGIVYIGSGSKVQALDGTSGKLLWTTDLSAYLPSSNIVNSSPVVDGNRLIIGDYGDGSGGGSYYCLDVTQQGKLLWKFACDAGCTAMSSACIDSGRVFVGQGQAYGSPKNGKVWCLDESTGKPVSTWGTHGYYVTDGKLDMSGTVTVFGAYIYFTDFIYFTDIPPEKTGVPNCHLYCLAKATGKAAWQMSTFGSDGAPAVRDGLIVIANQQPAAWPSPGTNYLTALAADTTTGKSPVKLWSRSGMGGYTMDVCIAGDKVAVGNSEEAFPPTATDTWVVNAGNGSTVWHSTEGGSSPVPTPYGLLSIGDGKMITFGTGSLPSGDYYFAEGTTRSGYQEWISLENPTAARVNASIDYMISGGGTKKQDVALSPGSRTTVDVNLFMGPGKDVSARVTGDGYFVAERSMYFNSGGINGGEQVMGVTDPARRFLYAEGTTRSGFQTWLALENPQSTQAKVVVTYLFADGTPPAQQNVTIPSNSRETVDVNKSAGADKDVSIALTSNQPIVGERVMYFTTPNPIMGSRPSGVHDSTGTAEASTGWYFAEGTTRSNFQEYLCLMDPGSRDATATIQYLGAGGAIKTEKKSIKANTRVTVDVNAAVGVGKDIAVAVTSDEPVVAERPMYFQYMPAGASGVLWKGGHDSMGAEYAAYKWEFAEGCTRAGYQTFLCIANPNAGAEDATICYFMTKPDGSHESKVSTVKVAASSRQTVFVNDAVGPDRDVSATVTCKDPVVVERPMYFSSGPYTEGGDSLGLPGAP